MIWKPGTENGTANGTENGTENVTENGTENVTEDPGPPCLSYLLTGHIFFHGPSRAHDP